MTRPDPRPSGPVLSLTGTTIEGAMRRAVLLFRILAVVWMAVMVVVTLVSDDGAQWLIVGSAMAVAVGGAIWSVRFLASDRPMTKRFLLTDIATGLIVAVAPQVAQASAPFYGGYPMSTILISTFAGGLVLGLAVGGGFLAVRVAEVITGAASAPTLADLISLAVMVGIVVIVVGVAKEILLGAEQRQRAAETALEGERQVHAVDQARLEERVELADDLHDSLLQIVRVIGQNADDPERVRTLARRQERDLRSMIERMHGGEKGAAAELRAVVADVEELFGVKVDLVATVDAPSTGATEELVKCAREIIVNAARHSGADRIDVTFEVTPASLAVVVIDRGAGFDPAVVDRGHGLESVRQRIERVGGSLRLVTAPGQGVEIELSLNRADL